MAVGVNVVPHFVKARTSEQLIKKMLQVQIRRGTHIPFFDIQKQDGLWYAWYNTEVRNVFPRTDDEIKKDEN